MTGVIHQGDLYWMTVEGSSVPHPYVVIQDDAINHSRVTTLVVCALTTNAKQMHAPGNVLLEPGEANLPKPSAVVVSKVSGVERSQVGEYIGSLSSQRIEQILAGMRFLQALTAQNKP